MKRLQQYKYEISINIYKLRSDVMQIVTLWRIAQY